MSLSWVAFRAMRPGTAFDLASHGAAVIAGTAIRMTFNSVTEDSRCRSDGGINCIWQGVATIQLSVLSAGHTGTLELSTKPLGKPIGVFGLSFELLGLRHTPSAGTAQRQGVYIATLRVDNGSP